MNEVKHCNTDGEPNPNHGSFTSSSIPTVSPAYYTLPLPTTHALPACKYMIQEMFNGYVLVYGADTLDELQHLVRWHAAFIRSHDKAADKKEQPK